MGNDTGAGEKVVIATAERTVVTFERDGSVVFADDLTAEELREVIRTMARHVASRLGSPTAERFDLPRVIQIHSRRDDELIALLDDGSIYVLNEDGTWWQRQLAVPGTEPVRPSSRIFVHVEPSDIPANASSA